MGFARNTAPEPRSRQPIDDTPDWLRIYLPLARLIGSDVAWSWFGNCRFVELTDNQLTLAHYNGFCASECLKRHGRDLARVAGVKAVKVFRSGGYRPASLEGEGGQQQGFELYRLPDLKRTVAPPNMSGFKKTAAQ